MLAPYVASPLRYNQGFQNHSNGTTDFIRFGTSTTTNQSSYNITVYTTYKRRLNISYSFFIAYGGGSGAGNRFSKNFFCESKKTAKPTCALLGGPSNVNTLRRRPEGCVEKKKKLRHPLSRRFTPDDRTYSW